MYEADKLKEQICVAIMQYLNHLTSLIATIILPFCKLYHFMCSLLCAVQPFFNIFYLLFLEFRFKLKKKI